MKKINVKLVAGLAIGLVVFLALTVFLHEWQSNRHADGLVDRAEELKDKGQYGDAIALLNNYIRRRDDKSQYGNLALTMKKMIEQNKADGIPNNPRVIQRTFNSLELALRENPANSELREALIEFQMNYWRRYADAIVHLDYLLNTDERKDDPDLLVKRATCYLSSGDEEEATVRLKQLVGYDDASRGFRPDQAIAPKEVDAYVLLAGILERSQRQDMATAVMNQLIRANGDSHEAYLARAGFMIDIRRDMDSATEDVDRAVELAPDDEIVLTRAGDFAMNDRNFDRAKTMYDRLVKINPDNMRAYMGLSQWSQAQMELNQALDYLSTAIEKAPGNIEVLWQRANLELQLGEPEKAEESLQQIIDAGAAQWFVNFVEGRIALAKGKWLLASEKLETARPMVVQFRQAWAVLLDLNLASCYEKLGKHDVRLGALQRVLDQQPDNLTARLNKALAHAALGQADRAINDYDFLRSREVDPKTFQANTWIAFLNLASAGG